MNATSAAEPDEGVYFENKDYASLSRRLFAILIDAAVLWVAAIILWQAIVYLPWMLEWPGYNVESAERYFWIVMIASVWFYLTVCKASSFRTLGFRLMGLQIITLKGTRVPWYQMTFRLLLWSVGPFNLILDACWIYADDARQTCRDCYSGTLVVRNNATESGQATLHRTC